MIICSQCLYIIISRSSQHPPCSPEESSFSTHGLSASTLDHPPKSFPSLKEETIAASLRDHKEEIKEESNEQSSFTAKW